MAKGPHNRSRRQETRPTPAALYELIRSCRLALNVYAVLRMLAAGKRQCCCTRKTIREKTGMNVKTVSKVMGALADAGWIKLDYGTRPSENRKWYRITFPFDELLWGVSTPIPRRPRPKKTRTSKRKPRTHQMGRSEATAEPAGSPDTAGSPQTHLAGSRDRATAQLAGPTAPDTPSGPSDQELGRRDASLDPSNGSKGNVPLDPPVGSHSLERAGGVPPPSPTLRCGGDGGTPQYAQRLAEGSREQPTHADGTAGDTGNIARRIAEIIAMIGSEARDTPDGGQSTGSTQAEEAPSTDEGGG